MQMGYRDFVAVRKLIENLVVALDCVGIVPGTVVDLALIVKGISGEGMVGVIPDDVAELDRKSVV